MRIVLFYHSALSDWSHGNAHFLRGVATELTLRGHDVLVCEPGEAWSLANLLALHGERPVRLFRRAYPHVRVRRYDLRRPDLDGILDRADLVLVHEWNDPALVARLGRHRRGAGYRLLFHDTHHRSVSDREAMRAYDLSDYDGVLAYGEVIRRIYLEEGWAERAWTWHEAADTRVFRPRRSWFKRGDLVWIGNWGDGERTKELREFLLDPVRDLGLKAKIYGVRYPDHALQALRESGADYGGWLPNFLAPREFARYRLTVHVPRRPYVHLLPGIPTIRPFEALACGIPLLCSPWSDTEGLFRPGRDFLVARDGAEMRRRMRDLLNDGDMARELAQNGLAAVRARHTCVHRVDELLAIHRELCAGAGRRSSLRRQEEAAV